jgi:metallophosphoesterase superfamily enzyme
MCNFIPFYPYPILILENSNEEKYLIITDIHIGFEDAINRKGVFIEPKKKRRRNSRTFIKHNI